MDINTELKKEIDTIIENHHLNNLLSLYGNLSVTGSYVYNLMAWKDYDVVLEIDEYTPTRVQNLIDEIRIKVNPDKIKLLDNTTGAKKNRPIGYWIGIYLDDWKIDLWVMNKINSEKEIKQTQELDNMLKNIDKDKLIDIKSELSKNPDYHIKFSSVDLYNGFVKGNVRTIDEFFEWLNRKI